MNKLIYILCVLCAFVVSSGYGCFGSLFGGKNSAAELKAAANAGCAEVLRETRITGRITINPPSVDDPRKPMTGTLTGELTNDSNPPDVFGPAGDDGSMILKLINMTWLFLVIQILATWGTTFILKIRGVKISLLTVSILINLLIISVSLLLTLALHWIKYNPIDIAGTQIMAWGVQALLYDAVIKKLMGKNTTNTKRR